jgi:hypothetical protein
MLKLLKKIFGQSTKYSTEEIPEGVIVGRKIEPLPADITPDEFYDQILQPLNKKIAELKAKQKLSREHNNT